VTSVDDDLAAEELAAEVVAAVAAGDPERARVVLHPYLRWTELGVTVRGRRRVLALLSGRSALAAAARVELRDGQIYRWYVDE
jgi:hypothetical protein